MRTRSLALTAFEVAVRRGNGTFAGHHLVGVHAQAHGAAGVTPFGTEVLEYLVESFLFRLQAHTRGGRHHEHAVNVLGFVMPLHNGGGHAQILKASVGAGADEHGIHGNVFDGRARSQTHVGNGTLGRGALGFVVERGRVRHHAGDLDALARIGAPGHIRFEIFSLDGHFLVEHGVIVGFQRLPVFDGFVPHFAFRRVRAALQVFERHFVRRDHAGAGACFDRHVADGHACVHRQFLDGFAAIFDDVPLAATSADLCDNRKNNVFCGDALRQLTFDIHGHGLERLQAQGLRCHNMFDFGGADADGHGTERAVRGSVRIAAHDRHARLRQSQYRRERVHHALIGVSQRAQTYAEILAVLFKRA